MDTQQEEINRKLIARLDAIGERFEESRKRDAALAEVIAELARTVSNLGDRINGRAS